MRFILTATLLLALAACQSNSEAVSRVQYQRHAQLTRSFAEAATAGDWEKLSHLYAEDAVLMPANSPVITGRAAIRDYFEALPPLVSLMTRDIEVENVGDKAVVRGEYTMVLNIDGQEVEDRGKYFELRIKQRGGQWQIWRDMYSSDLPAQGQH